MSLGKHKYAALLLHLVSTFNAFRTGGPWQAMLTSILVDTLSLPEQVPSVIRRAHGTLTTVEQIVDPLLKLASHKLNNTSQSLNETGQVLDANYLIQEMASFAAKLIGLPEQISGLFKLVLSAVNGDMEQVFT